MADTLYIVDGSAYIYRAFYAIRNLSNSKGFPTNAIYGFILMLRKLLEQENPEYLAVTFDPFGEPEPTFRTEMFPEYKANRSEMPEDLRVQLPYFTKFVEAMSIPILKVPGVEADDVIATLTRQSLSDEDWDICIVSADKDLLQLLGDERVRMIDTMRDKTYTAKEAQEKFGVEPDKIKYVMSLWGDSSDNIPGVPGIGQKTGAKLINEFGDLETLLANIDKVSGKKRKENLHEFADQARLSLELVKLKDDVEVDLDPADLKVTSPSIAKLTDVMSELEFRSPLKDIKAWMRTRGFIDGESTPAMPDPERMAPDVDKEYRAIFDESDLDEAIEACMEADRFAIDLETTSIDPLSAKIVGVSLAWEPHVGVYIPVGHRQQGEPRQLTLDGSDDQDDDGLVPDQLGLELVLEKLKPLFEEDMYPKVAQHYKYEWIVLRRHGVALAGIEWDTMLMSYLLDPGKNSHSLDTIAQDYLRFETIKYSEVAGKGKNEVNFEFVDIDDATEYAAEDADITLIACDKMEKTIVDAGLREIHDDIEIPLSIVLARMEEKGICIDTEILSELSEEFEAEIDKLQDAINEAAGEDVNPNSPVQLREVLFDKLGLPVKKRTQTGPSTDQSVLEQLRELHELPSLILEYRSFSKLKGTYIDALPELIREDTGRIHTDFNQAVTATGRLSSSNPNLQNIPIRSDRGREIRRAFVPAEGKTLICADYSQIELRIMAHMSGDPKLVEAYQNGADIHRLTASQIFDVDFDDITADQRRAGKTINFGVMYGMGSRRLARDLSISTKEAKTYIENYFDRYQGVSAFFEQLKSRAREVGYAETLFGRRRILSEINGYGRQRAFAERVAVNMPIQGTAADIIKVAMLRIQERIDDRELPLSMLLQVHDELVFEVDDNAVEEARAMVVEEMEGVIEMDVPLSVDAGVGPNWMDAK